MNVFIQTLFSCVPEGRFFGMDMQTVLQTGAYIFSITLVGIVLTRILYNPIRDFLRQRVERITSQLEDARVSKAAASELKAKYDHQLMDIEVERAAILDEARKHAGEQREHILSTAKDEAKDLKDRAGMEIEAERMRIRDEIHSAILDISTEMAEKLLVASIDKKAHERLFDEGLAELERALYMENKEAF